MRPFIRQVFGIEGDAGVVTLDIIANNDTEGNVIQGEGHVSYHSRTPIEGAEYQGYCNYLQGPCYSVDEVRYDLPKILIQAVPASKISVEEVKNAMDLAFTWITELYHYKFRGIH